MNDQNIQITDAVRNHLASFLGPPTQVLTAELHEPSLPFASVELAHFNAAPNQPSIFASCGLANNQILDGRRMELLFIAQNGTQDHVRECAFNLLASMVSFAATAVPPLNYGGMIAAGEYLSSISPMEGLVFFPPFILVNAFHGFAAPDGSPVQLLWMVPIYESEADYAAQYEPRALANLFGVNELNLTDLQRPQANVDMSPDQIQSFLDTENEPSAPTSSPGHQPSEITAEQIAKFRASNEVVVDVSQRYRPGNAGSKAIRHQTPPPRTATIIPAPTPQRTAQQKDAPQKEIRFDLETGKELDDEEIKRRRREQAKAEQTRPQVEPELSPEEQKQKKIAALKAAAKAAKERSGPSD